MCTDVFYVSHLDLDGKKQSDTLNIPLITTTRNQVLVTVSDCLRFFPHLRASTATQPQLPLQAVTDFQHESLFDTLELSQVTSSDDAYDVLDQLFTFSSPPPSYLYDN